MHRVSRISYAVIALLIINQLVGIVGLNNRTYFQIFENLSGINLLLSFLLVICFHSPINKNLILFCSLAFSIGMVAEIVGVNTGYLFGHYSYTGAFGPEICRVPVIIGINWILLSYVSANVIAAYTSVNWQRITGASILMVAIDLLLESFATRHHFWVWQNSFPPVKNYISWFFVSLFIQFTFSKLLPDSLNVVGNAYFLILILFLLSDFVFAFLC